MVAADGDGGACPTVRPASVPRLPRLPTHIVDRSRLLELLDTPAPLVILRAPTGFGKTTLQAMWADRRPAVDTLAWVSLDDDDRDPVLFWTTILDALYDVGVPIDRDAVGQRAARRQVRRAIETSPSPITLVIDGYDDAPDRADADLVDLLRRFRQLRLVVAARGHLRFPPGTRVGLDTVVIDATDLLFTAREVADLLTAHGTSISEEYAATVIEQTNGWPALAAALADGAAADNLSADYVRSHLLPQIDDVELRRFLLVASIPDPLTADIMLLLTDDASAGDKLRRLESAGALFATMESGSATYQVPRAMRTALEARANSGLAEPRARRTYPARALAPRAAGPSRCAATCAHGPKLACGGRGHQQVLGAVAGI